MRFTSAMQMSMYAVSPLISVSDIFYFEMRRKRFEEKATKISFVFSVLQKEVKKR
tara:strand:- start:1677 stop:1841 length:165 start_codon:yes stop_codon:yes gene_type:complete